MKALFIYGFGVPASGDGNGLHGLLDRVQTQWPELEPQGFSCEQDLPGVLELYSQRLPDELIVVAHSYGGAAIIRAANQVPTARIKLALLLDPVPRWRWGQCQLFGWNCPTSIEHAVCYMASGPMWSCALKGPRSTAVDCRTIDGRLVDHWQITSNPKVQRSVLFQIQYLSLMAAHGGKLPPLSAPAEAPAEAATS